ncbi:hypothetical protein [Streptococcus mitis]|uniref:Uncharacterized protein n=1 Tax=Streptococcus mitis TaxID=28037 RepID=A0A6I1TUD0_STRMT|nr:hypothetical protein [Streptococcus mitis]MQQ28988.1 hypothetical protein [Streptococcus mitis]
MPTISLTCDIKLTNEDALKIFNHQPSEKLQEILKSIESQDTTTLTENKLISKYLQLIALTIKNILQVSTLQDFCF